MEFSPRIEQGKRRRNEFQSFPFLFSQHSKEAEQDTEMFAPSPPATKRLRTCGGDFFLSPPSRPLSPGIVSVATSDCNNLMDTTSVTTATANDGTTAIPAQWWKQASEKQKRRHLPILGENDLLCHVCESVYTKPTASSSSLTTNATCSALPTNSLLAYKFTSSSVRKHPSPQTAEEVNKSATCTFCERGTCPQCLDQCEECLQKFCTFCIKEDYWGAFARVLCKDCQQSQSKTEEDHDSMNLG